MLFYTFSRETIASPTGGRHRGERVNYGVIAHSYVTEVKMCPNPTQLPRNTIKERHTAALYDRCGIDARMTPQFSRWAQLRHSDGKINHMGAERHEREHIYTSGLETGCFFLARPGPTEFQNFISPPGPPECVENSARPARPEPDGGCKKSEIS